LNFDRAPVGLDDAARDRETEADAASVTALRLPELSEQPRDLGRRYSRPSV
jgi:hypothetical protein